MGSLCHPCITKTHLFYSILSLKFPPQPFAVILGSKPGRKSPRVGCKLIEPFSITTWDCPMRQDTVDTSGHMLIGEFPGTSHFLVRPVLEDRGNAQNTAISMEHMVIDCDILVSFFRPTLLSSTQTTNCWIWNLGHQVT